MTTHGPTSGSPLRRRVWSTSTTSRPLVSSITLAARVVYRFWIGGRARALDQPGLKPAGQRAQSQLGEEVRRDLVLEPLPERQLDVRQHDAVTARPEDAARLPQRLADVEEVLHHADARDEIEALVREGQSLAQRDTEARRRPRAGRTERLDGEIGREPLFRPHRGEQEALAASDLEKAAGRETGEEGGEVRDELARPSLVFPHALLATVDLVVHGGGRLHRLESRVTRQEDGEAVDLRILTVARDAAEVRKRSLAVGADEVVERAFWNGRALASSRSHQHPFFTAYARACPEGYPLRTLSGSPSAAIGRSLDLPRGKSLRKTGVDP